MIIVQQLNGAFNPPVVRAFGIEPVPTLVAGADEVIE
ncbi:hypothetical protein ACVWXO_002719 [Bradyrhizobium sp. LM2.7]